MNIIENELQRLKSGIIEIWESVLIQIQKARVVFETGDTDLVHEMAAGEKRIDSFELKNDLECEFIRVISEWRIKTRALHLLCYEQK
ncbi:MAG: hypothetical protein ABR974_02080 [Bacteroidales bacterium]|jgi:hypothetical protein